MDNGTASSSQVNSTLLSYLSFLAQYLFQKFCINRHLADHLCKWDIYFYFLENIQEFKKLFFSS